MEFELDIYSCQPFDHSVPDVDMRSIMVGLPTYCRFQTARQIRPRSRPARHTRSSSGCSVCWRTGTVPGHRSSGSKSRRPRHCRLNSLPRRRSARTRGCTSCFYTGTGSPDSGGRLQGQKSSLTRVLATVPFTQPEPSA